MIVATDSEQVAQAVRANGFEVAMTRADHPSGTDRLAEVALAMGWPDDTIIVNVQGDEPLIDPALIDSVAVHLAAHTDCAIATAAHPIVDARDIFNPNVVKTVLDAYGRALYFSRAPIPWMRDTYPPTLANAALAAASPSSPPPFPVYRHVGLYAYRVRFLRIYPGLPVAPIEQAEALEQLRALWHGERIAVLITGDVPAAGVDTAADLERARAVFGNQTKPTMA